MRKIEFNCFFCGYDLFKLDKPTYPVIVNNKLVEICENCFNLHFAKTNKKCEICGQKVSYPYFLVKDKKIKLICKSCQDRIYGDDD